MLAYHCYRVKPILFCANTILFTEKGPWHFSNISTSRCRSYLNVEVIDRQCVYRNNFHLQNNSASYKFFIMYSRWETFSGFQYSNVWTKWWTYKYWWATESHLCYFVLGCCVFFFIDSNFLVHSNAGWPGIQGLIFLTVWIILQSGQVKRTPKIPLMNLLLKSWIHWIVVDNFQFYLCTHTR